MSHPSHACDLSVVIASADAFGVAGYVNAAIRALRAACANVSAELILVDAADSPDAERLRAVWPDVRVYRMPAGTLVPRLWSEGLSHASGRAVAFTLGTCVVEPTWATSLLRALDAGAAGAAGAMTCGRGITMVDRAVFYLRYSPFIAPVPGTVADGEIPGDNAAYRRDLLERHSASFGNGFWEIDFHRRVRRDGEHLAFADGAVAALQRGVSFGMMLSQRYAHGRHFGGWRVTDGARSRWQVVAAAPLVPLVLVARIARRVLPHRGHATSLLLALPALLAFAVAWAAGEAAGALAARPPRRLQEAIA